VHENNKIRLFREDLIGLAAIVTQEFSWLRTTVAPAQIVSNFSTRAGLGALVRRHAPAEGRS